MPFFASLFCNDTHAYYRVDKGGCDARDAHGLFLWFMTNRSWVLTDNLARQNYMQRCAVEWDCWADEVSCENIFCNRLNPCSLY